MDEGDNWKVESDMAMVESRKRTRHFAHPDMAAFTPLFVRSSLSVQIDRSARSVETKRVVASQSLWKPQGKFMDGEIIASPYLGLSNCRTA